jgi:hypothetical protein
MTVPDLSAILPAIRRIKSGEATAADVQMLAAVARTQGLTDLAAILDRYRSGQNPQTLLQEIMRRTDAPGLADLQRIGEVLRLLGL